MQPDNVEASPKREIEFEWSAKKAVANAKKHRVSFEEAETAFDDEFAWVFDDELHSEYEETSR